MTAATSGVAASVALSPQAARERQVRFAAFLLSRAASALGDQLLLFAAPLIVYTATGSITMSGLAFMIEWLPRVLSLPVAGMLADRFGGMRVYVSADTVRALACIVAVLALGLWPGHAFGITAALMSACAFCYAQAFVSLESTVPLLLPKADIPRAQSLLQGIDQSAAVAGPALAGLLALWWPPAQVLWLAAAVFGASALGVLALRGLLTPLPTAPGSLASPAPPPNHVGLFEGLRGAAGVLLQHRILLSLVALSMAVNLVVGIAMATGAAVTLGRFAQPNAAFASLQGAVGLLAVAVLVVTPWALRRCSVHALGIAAFLMVAAGGLVMAWAPGFQWFVLGYAIVIASCGPFNVFIRTERLNWIPKEQLGRVISLIILLNQFSLPAAGLIVALAGARASSQGLYAAVALAALGVFALVRGRIRREALTARPAAR